MVLLEVELLVVELLPAPVELVDVSFKDFTGDSVLEEFISLLAPVTKCTADERSKSANGRRKSLMGAIVTTSFYSTPHLLFLALCCTGMGDCSFVRLLMQPVAGGRSTSV